MRVVYPGEIWRFQRDHIIRDYLILNAIYRNADASVAALSAEGKKDAITVWSEKNKHWFKLDITQEEFKACIL